LDSAPAPKQAGSFQTKVAPGHSLNFTLMRAVLEQT